MPTPPSDTRDEPADGSAGESRPGDGSLAGGDVEVSAPADEKADAAPAPTADTSADPSTAPSVGEGSGAVTGDRMSRASTAATGADPALRTRSRGGARRTDWRLGGRTTARWRELVLGVAVLALGAGLIVGGVADAVLPASVGGVVGTLVLWTAMLAVVVWAFLRSRPVYLLRFSAKDLLWGLGLGLIVRTCQGWLEIASGGSGALPSYPTIGGQLPDGWLMWDLIGPVVIAPTIEELFFRGVVLVSLYTLLRRPFGAFVAGLAAGMVSTGLFVLAHWLIAPLTVDGVLSIALLGIVCSALVLLTGRIWGAVLVHAVFNGTYVVLALAGTWLG